MIDARNRSSVYSYTRGGTRTAAINVGDDVRAMHACDADADL
jgi:hypothetical protein